MNFKHMLTFCLKSKVLKRFMIAFNKDVFAVENVTIYTNIEWLGYKHVVRVYKRTFICRMDNSLQEFTRVLLSVEWTLLYKSLQEYFYL